MSHKVIRYMLSGSLISLTLGTSAAFAQTSAAGQGTVAEQEEPRSDAVGEIIVTAQKRSERINDVPLSITAATGGDLSKAGVTDTSQLVKIVPGFTYQLSAYGTPVYGLRGISFYDTAGTAQPAVSVYVDQVPLPLSILARGASLDVERVEVLKGPQGTLFGENATGGAINYIAAKPTKELSAGADLLYGRFNQIEVGGYVSGPLSDTVSVRLSGKTEQRSDWQVSTTHNDSAGQRNFTMARLLVAWEPNESGRFELNVNGWRDRSDSQVAQFQRFTPNPPVGGYAPAIAALTAYAALPNVVANSARDGDWDPGYDLRKNDKFFQVALRGDVNLSEDVTLTTLTSYIDFSGVNNSDPDGTNYNDIVNTKLNDINVISQELRFSYDKGPFKALFGGYYQYSKLFETDDSIIESVGSFLAGNHNIDIENVNNQKVETYAVFGGIDYDLGNGIKLQGSLRYTQQNRDFVGCGRDGGDGSFAISFNRISGALSGQPGNIQPGDCFTLSAVTFRPLGLISKAFNENNLSWKAGASWEPNSRTLLYANVTKGFKAGGFSTLPYATDRQINPIVQESVLAYEAGFKLTLADGRMQLNGAAFLYDYKNKQIQGFIAAPPFPNLPGIINVPKSKIKGAEVSLVWRPFDALRLSASGTYIDAKVTRDYNAFTPFGALANINGERLPATPRWQGNIDAEYSVNLEGSLQPYLGASLAFQSKSESAFLGGPEFILQDRALLDLRAGVEAQDGKWRIEAFGRNVTNKYYWVNVALQTDVVNRLAGLPTTYGVRATFRY